MSMVDGKWDGLYMKGHAPDFITWQNWDKETERETIPEDWKWMKFREVDKKSCKYAGYENCKYGDESPMLYLRFSLKTGKVTGIKRSEDDLDSISENWNNYDTPKGLKGRKYDPYLYKIHIKEKAR